MLDSGKDKPFFKAIKGKVIAASVLALVAIVLAISITYFSFRGLLGTVDALASPNQKLNALHNLFQRITQLDQSQRAEAIQNPNRSYVDFLKESKSISLALDTLKQMNWIDQHQVARLGTMENILHQRNKLFLSYLKVKSDFIYNRNLSEKLDTLTDILSDNALKGDTSVRTTERKTVTTTYIPPTEEKDTRSVFSRIFGKKKESAQQDTRVEVKEELSVKVDTVAIAQQDSAMAEVGRIMKSLESDQRLRNKKMANRELELINTNTVLMNQLLSILHEVEEEELVLMRANNDHAAKLVNTSIKRIGVVMIVFLLGTAFLVFLILIDVARSNYYRMQLIEAKDEAEQLSQVKQRFLANMSHEIRTPLQTILGFSEQLKGDVYANQEATLAIHTSSEHLLHIVNEVLDYSRIESGKLTVVREPFNLYQLVREVSSGINMQAARKDLSFTFDAQHLPEHLVLGDAFRLKQILYNILGNAIKFTQTGFVEFTIQWIEINDGGECVFKISDSGIGMTPDEINVVFHQFEQAHNLISSQYGGTGLGLTIVKALVDAQGGSIRVESEYGKGSVFIVKLHFLKADDTKVLNTVITQADVNPFTGRVLLVDDDPLILRLCSIILEKYNMPYVAFRDPQKVLHLNLDDIGLILLDIRMPTMSGAELCRALRRKVKNGTRIIALTAHVLPEEHEALLLEGFDEILTKPFREQMLVALLGLHPLTEPTTESIGVDFNVIKRMTMGDETLFLSILSQFRDETHDDLSALKHHLKQGDAKATREVVHKLAGRLGQIGASSLSAKLRELENDLDKGGKLTDVASAITHAIHDVNNVLDQVQAIQQSNAQQ